VVGNGPPRDAVEPETIGWRCRQIRQPTPGDDEHLRDHVVDLGAVDPAADVGRDQGCIAAVELVKVLHQYILVHHGAVGGGG
jgi:hypothetical protein